MREQFKQIFSAWLSTISAKLVIGIIFLVGSISIFIYVFGPSQAAKQSYQLLGERAIDIAEMNCRILVPVLNSDGEKDLDAILKAAVRKDHLEFILVHDAKGELCSGYNSIKAEQLNYKEVTGPGRLSDDETIYISSAPIIDNGDEIGRLYLGLSTAETRAIVARYKSIIGWACALFLILGVIVSILLKKSIVTPVNRLNDTIKKLAEGDLTRRSAINAGDEIGVLAESLNEMVNYWESSQRKWGNLNQNLEQRVSSRTMELEDEINERKKAEEELRHFTARLERSNRELEDFAFVASHDLQEPLRKVQAFGDRLKAVCADELSEKGLVYLERMQSAAGRMQTLIKDLLTFSRISSKAQPFVPLDLNKIAREVLSDMEVSIERQGGRVELGELQEVEADPLQMRQLFQNLIGNGLKFHKEDEPPLVKVYGEIIKERRGSHGHGKNLCHLVVEDNGIGFDEKYCDRIFTVFQRLHGRSEYEGTGLGLAVCRKIVERHSGTITAQSEPGKGSKFIITMPVKQNIEETDKIEINQGDSPENKDEQQKLQSEGMETSFMVPCS